MTGYLKATACALAFCVAGQAQAASFITYKIFGTASLKISSRSAVLPQYGSGNFEATYVVPIGTGGLIPATIEGGDYVGRSSLYFGSIYSPSSSSSARATGNRLVFSDIGISAFGNALLASSTFDLCLGSSTNNAFPTTGALAVDPSCSTARFNYISSGIESVGSATITSATASIGTVNPGSYGLQAVLTVSNFVAAIPEPGTWTLMIAGFAMSGYALRRRRVRYATA